MKSKDLTNRSQEHDLDISPNTRDTRNPLATMRAEMNRLMDRLFDDFNRPSTVFRSDLGSYTPQIDLNEDEESIEVKAEMPGMDEKDIDVSVNEDRLIIKGEKKEETEDKQKNQHFVERQYGYFQRAITLPSEIEAKEANASFKNGILKLHLPKSKEARKNTHKIKVKAG